MINKQIFDFSILRDLRKQNGMSIAILSRKSGVSSSVISKLERNQTVAELETIYRLGKVFGISAADMISLTEARSSHCVKAGSHTSEDFVFDEVIYGNVRCLYGHAPAGAKVSRPQIHRDDYELCWVLKGKVHFKLPNETHDLCAGDSLQFDALLEHSYEAIEDTEMIVVHLRKDKRF